MPGEIIQRPGSWVRWELGKTWDVHRYQLIPRGRLNSQASSDGRAGALLRFSFEDGSVGYSDCFPWPELGDLPLSSQLDLLSQGKPTSLMQRSIWFAEIDAAARRSALRLWDGVRIPASHALVPQLEELTRERLEEFAQGGFNLLKIKVGKEPHAEALYLSKLVPDLERLSLKVRLDFNSSLSADLADEFLVLAGAAVGSIDLIEDPTPYDPLIWAQLQKKWGVRLALDRIPNGIEIDWAADAFSVIVLKPAVQDVELVVRQAIQVGKPIVVTSYLDHPVGQFEAAWVAAQLQRVPRLRIEPCGLLSHFVYYPNPFSSVIETRGPFLIPPGGTGFGLDNLLKGLMWQKY